MRQYLATCVATTCFLFGSTAYCQEIVEAGPVFAAPVASTDTEFAARAEESADVEPQPLSPAMQALHNYVYFTYPQYVETLRQRIVLAQTVVDVLQARERAYGAFASFGHYSAAWTAAQDNHVSLLIAEQHLATLRRIDADLWLYHRANIASMLAFAASVP